ncbi:hypothetical protein PVK06_037294 [Gossypium arboreum]|uniref:Uncharacterized protein n=1 Tax=Gossypium arboreum TaxID=29729 RepID=A0ABR0MZF3_GOSAR|nr:hypothetical protein PVK06_037294 [Gossypium arboreum]
MAIGWIKYLQCKSRVFEDVYQPNPKHLILSSSCRRSSQSIKDVIMPKKSDPKLVPRSGGKPEPDLSDPPPRPRRSGSSSTPARPVGNHDTVLPALTELAEGHPSRNVVEIIFHTSWSPRSFTGRIDMIFKVQSRSRTVTRFEEYRETVRSGRERGNAVPLLGSCLGDCGVNDSWLFSDGKEKTICTYAGSGGAHESAGGGKGRRAMLVCRVIAGRVSKRMGFEYESSMDWRTGYDSVCGNNGELLVFDRRAVLPCFLIIYKL